MSKDNKKTYICWNIAKLLTLPWRRLRKFRNMKQYRVAIAIIAVSSCCIILLLYYWNRMLPKLSSRHIPMGKLPYREEDTVHVIGTPMRHIPLDLVYKDIRYKKDDYEPLDEEDDTHLTWLKTPGCEIPLTPIQYRKNKQKPNKTYTCGKRAVFLEKVGADKVKAFIKVKIVKTYLRKSALFQCCYRFLLKSNRRGQQNKRIRFTPCKHFEDGTIITLESDFVNVKCSEIRNNNISREVYDDVYPFIKMINTTKKPKRSCAQKYNVLLLGLDSVSLSRFVEIMESTSTYLLDNAWLTYTAYNKVGDNTIPNLMAALTGQNLTSIKEKCSGKMDKCQDLLIWNKFRDAGYVTAYGEDYLKLPDTFHDEFAFTQAPTDHYLRPLFIKGETVHNKSLVCAGKRSSGQQLLDYAFDFALTYRTEQFIGMFWMNSYSHNPEGTLENADALFENFFNRLTYTGVMDNTFVVFFSDHGIRFGELRMSVESYYDERLPFMFIWTPSLFIGIRTRLSNALAINRNRLVTPYDLYNTLVDILRISSCDRLNEIVDVRAAEGCPNCHSLLKIISPNRTCADVAIHEKWCPCHKLYPLDVDDVQVGKSVKLILSHIKNISQSAPTKRCSKCMPLTLKNVARVHFYYDEKKVFYHVIALTMVPGNMSYEATVLRNGNAAEIVGPISRISKYSGTGVCTLRHRDRLFCFCQKISPCRK